MKSQRAEQTTYIYISERFTRTGTVAVVIVDGDSRTVDGDLLEVGAAMTVELGVKIRIDTALQQRIVGKVHPTYDVARLVLFQ